MMTHNDPLAALWRPPALMAVVLSGEALAALLALALSLIHI